MKEIVIQKNEAGQRLDKWLAKYLNKAPKSFFYKMLRKKNIKLNHAKAEGSEKLCEGDSVQFYLSDATIEEFRERKQESILKVPDADVLYEDDNVILLNKPVGILSQRATKEDVSMVEILIAYLLRKHAITAQQLETFRPSVCNRLDRNTSGIVVAGKSLAGLQQMSLLFADRSLHKYYRCIVKGKMNQDARITGFLHKNEETNKVVIKSKKEASEDVYIETQYHTIVSSEEYTLLEVLLITGKTHQIRAHLNSIGHPIIGDYKYGNANENAKMKKIFCLESQLLHAYRLEFPQITGPCANLSGKVFVCEPSDLFSKIVNTLFKGGI